VYCTEVLHLSEHEAYLRIAVARASRKHPTLLTKLCDGRLHLSAIALLAPHLDKLDEVRREKLLASATHKSKRQVEELVAALAPRPDVAATMLKRPQRGAAATPKTTSQLGPDRVDPPASPADSRRPVPAESPAKVEPLAPARYKVTFTASAELRDKLSRLQSLLRTAMPGADLAEIIKVAVTEKLERLEARRFGKTKAPRKDLDTTDTSPGSRYIPAAVKRVVVARDGDRCTFVNANGKRCSEREGLEFHHDEPYALGGDRGPSNIYLHCRAHNVYLAEATYGEAASDYTRVSRS
jgi:hypothetical protein